MVKHIVIWDLNAQTQAEKEEDAKEIKLSLEMLNGNIPGLISLDVRTKMIDGADIVLESVHEDMASLETYRNHPAHLVVAKEVVRPRTQNRRSADFYIN